MSIWHLIIILIIVLMFFGPSRLEGLGSSLGKAIRGFKKGIDGDDEKPTSKTEAEKKEEIRQIEHLSAKEKEKDKV